jgi:PAS domain S-box-containing protein/putative nucleotidyltransferase with HDIG domain
MVKHEPTIELATLREQVAELEECKRARARLEAERQTAYSILNSLPAFVYLQAADHSIPFANRRIRELLGEPGSTPCYNFFHKRDEPCEDCPTLRVLDTGAPEVWEWTDSFDGRTYQVYDYPFTGGDGAPLVLDLAIDITHRKRAEQALHDREVSYKELADSIADVFFAMDGDLRCTYWNRASEVLTGIPAEQAIGRSLYDIFPDIKGTEAEQLYLDVLKSRQPQTVVNEYDLGGKHYFLELSAYPSSHGLSVFVKDITNRKRAAEALRRLTNFNESIILNMGEGIVVQDTQGFITLTNPAAAALLRYGTDELVGQHWTAIVPPDQHDTIRAADRRRAQGQSDRYEAELLGKDGTKVSVIVSGSPRYEVGEFAGTLAVFADITERRRAEEELRRSHASLRKTLEQTINALAAAVEARDPYTAGHQRQVATLASAIADEMGLTEDQKGGIRMAGLIHDVGKIQVPAEILSKPSQLSDIELTIVKTHPLAGYEILSGVEFPWPVAQIVLQHHERLDGSGYPLGLHGQDILLEARILAVADVVEAMASHRPYRPAHTLEEALDEISRNRGTFYDPEVVDACLRLFTERGYSLN